MGEVVFINGIAMKPGKTFGRIIDIKEFRNKKKRKIWLDEDKWEVENI